MATTQYSPAEERLHRKQRLAAAFRIFGQWGLGEGAAGHITVRVHAGNRSMEVRYSY